MQADVIDVSEFPHLGQKYSVMGVPKIVINERTELVGAGSRKPICGPCCTSAENTKHLHVSAREKSYVIVCINIR